MTVFSREDLIANHSRYDIFSTTPLSQFAVMNLADGEASGTMPSEHPQSDQWVYVLEGAGQLRVGDETIDLHAGAVALVPAGADHQVIGPNKTLNFYAPVAYPE